MPVLRMALSVTVRKLDPVVFPGDLFRCIIEFKNAQKPSGEADIDNNKLESLAWASAQIYGQYIADPSLMKLPVATQQRQQVGSTLPKLGMNQISHLSYFWVLCC